MNERIEQCLYLSGLTAQGCWDELDVYAKQGIHKFAELIVRECVNTLDQQYVTISDDADPEDNKTWIGATMNTTVARCKHSILSNFGVAE